MVMQMDFSIIYCKLTVNIRNEEYDIFFINLFNRDESQVQFLAHLDLMRLAGDFKLLIDRCHVNIKVNVIL